MSDKEPNLDSLFEVAVEMKSAAERAAYLDQACGDDLELRRQVELLLQSDEQAGSFLNQPPVELEATILTSAASGNLAAALEAGLAPAFTAEQAVVLGDGNHSVLKMFGQTIAQVPRVALRDSVELGPEPITRSKSPEMPKGNSDSRYQLQGEIARGGMGAILRGRDTDLGRDLAIKVLLDQHKNKPEVVQRFIEEAQIGGQLQHPGIAPIYELGQFADKRPFFSMKLVKGKTLANLLADREDATEDRGRFIGIFEQICQTMAYAHSRGVIHRDLKPANIMVGAFGEVQVMDWGLAKVLSEGGIADEKTAHTKHKDVSIIQTMRSVGSDSPGTFGTVGSHTQMGSVMGTPAYMPPEQALGEIDQLDERADVFGLGAILCEILTGKPPYVANDGTQVFRMASRGKLEDCFQRLDACGADEDLIGLAKHCLQLEPKDRPRSAGVLAEGVTEYLESVETKLREAEIGRATQAARADAESHQAEAERRQAEAERQRADAESQRAKSQSQAARRLRVIVACVALVAVLAGATAVLFQRYGAKQIELAEQQNNARAATLVDGLLNAEIARVPGILQQIELERAWVDPLLAAQRTEHSGVPQVQRRLALTLQSPPQDVETLREWLLAADVDDLPVVHQVLNGQPELVRASFWKIALDSQLPSEKRLRAACALATLDPKHADWSRLGTFAANQLLEQPLLLLDKWSDLLRPVHGHLLDQLEIAFRDTAEEQRSRREKATVLLAKQFNKQSDVLVDLLLDADAHQFEAILNPLQQDRERAITLLEAAMGKDVPALPNDGQRATSLADEVAAFQKQITDNLHLLSLAEFIQIKSVDNLKGIEALHLERRNRDARVQHASRQANAAVALARLGETRNVWPLLRETPHPDARSFLIHRLGPYAVDPQLVVDRLAAETDVSIRRALILSLNEFPEEALQPFRAGLTTELLARYRSDPDPGIHAATSWVLYKWEQRNQVFGIDFAQKAMAPQPASRWYVNGDLQTMVMLPPGTFARATGPENQASPSHRIDRAFAIGSTLIPPKGKWPLHQSGEFGNWFSAAAYCNELSKREGIPPDQWCYETNPERGDAIWLDENKNNYARLAPDYLSRTGYRMPTEAEWEYACRAGTVTSRYYGDSDRLLEHYAWCRGNTNGDYPSPMATLKPNDFGLFDMVGNRRQICVGRFTEQVPGLLPRWDLEMSDLVVKHSGTQILRGTDYNAPLAETTAAARLPLDEIYQGLSQGLRVVRTLPLDMCRAAFGDDHPATCGALYSEAILALGRGDQERVAALDQQLLEHASAAMGKDPERWRTALHFAARLAHRRGQLDLARQRCDELLADSPLDLSLAELRLEVTTFANAEKHFAATKIADPWAKLAVVYKLSGNQQAYDKLLEQHPQAAAGLGDVYAATKDWQRAITTYSKAIAPETNDAAILIKRAEAYKATQQWDLASADLSRALQHVPESEQAVLAGQLADFLLDIVKPWTVLTPSEMKTAGGATLTLQADGSILASGENPARDVYTLAFRTKLQQINLIRLEAIPDPSLAGNGSGRSLTGNGNFHLNEIKVFSAGKPVTLTNAVATFQETNPQGDTASHAIDGSVDTRRGWSVFQRETVRHALMASLELHRAVEDELKIELHCSTAEWPQHNLGRFRLSVMDNQDAPENSLAILAAMQFTDPWQKLAAAYWINGNQQAYDKLLEQHPSAAAGIGDLYAANGNWERAIAAYSKLITDQTTDVNLLSKRAAAYIATEQWDLAEADWLRVIKQQPDQAQNAFDAFKMANRLEQAVKMREEAMTLLRQEKGPEHNDTLTAMGKLADAYGTAGRKEEVLKLREELVSLLRKVKGPEDPGFLWNSHQIARLYTETGRPDEAIKLREEMLPIVRKTNGPKDPFTLQIMNKLAELYDAAGRKDDAAKLRAEVGKLKDSPPTATNVVDPKPSSEDPQRAVAEYSKQITDQTTDVTLLTKRAAAYVATEQWELAKADWLRVIKQQPDQAQKAFDAFKIAKRWQEAAEFGGNVIELDPKKTMSWLQQAPVIVLAGDAAAYRAFCERMVKQFDANADDTSSTHTLKACLLQPGMIDLARLPVAVFEKRLDDGTTPEATRHFRWGLRGLLALRSGEFELAVKYIGQAEELKPTEISRAMNLSVLALAQHGLQHPDEAKTTLAAAAQLFTQIKQALGNNQVHHDLLIAEILFREAAATIGGNAKSNDDASK